MADAQPVALALVERAETAMYRLRADLRGSEREAYALLEELEAVPAGPEALRARAIAHVTIASAEHVRSRASDARPHVDAAIEAARKGGDNDALARGLRLLARGYRAAGQPFHAFRCLSQAYGAAQRAGGARLITTLMMDVALARSRVGLHADALELLTVAEARFAEEKRGLENVSGVILGTSRAVVLQQLGRRDEAIALLEDRVASSGLGDDHYYIIYARGFLAKFQRERGTPLPLGEILRWRELASAQDLRASAGLLSLEAAELLVATEPARAIEHLEAFDAFDPTDFEIDDTLRSFDLRARAHEALGQPERAIAELRRSIEHARSLRDEDAAGAAFAELDEQVRVLETARAEEQERASELSRIVDELMGLQHAVDTMVQDAVHDIRGPLTALELATSAMDGDNEDALAHVRAAIETINDTLGALAEGKVHGPASGARNVDVGAVLQRAADTYRSLAQRKSTTIEVERTGRLRIAGDGTRARRLVGNLLTNAIKFSPPGSEVRMVARERPTHVEVRIEDAGPGFPSSCAAFLARGARGDARPTAGESSSGLGLDIAQRLARAIGAMLAFENGPNGGIVRVEFRRA